MTSIQIRELLRGITLVFLSVLLVTCLSAKAADSPSENNSQASPEALPPEEDQPKAKAKVKVKVIVPQMKEPRTRFTIFPYMVKPPKLITQIEPLPDKDPVIKTMLLGTGYSNRVSLEKPYPPGGWRWQYAYRNALKRSGLSTPKLMMGAYSFSKDMVKYIKPEILRLNEIEATRKLKYMKAVQDYEDNHKDEEMEALKHGLEPVPLKLKALTKDNKIFAFESQCELGEGEWWVTGEHKVAGLIYYWQEPVKVKAGEVLQLTMDDSNAILIQGGW